MTETSITPAIKAEIISESMPYIRRFHGKTIVIKFGGNAMIDEQLQKSFAHDVALLKLIGLNPIVVHGGGPQIDKALKRLGKEGTFLQGMRVTDADTMEVVEWVLGGQVQQDIVMMINQAGGKAVGLTGKDGGLIKAKKKLMDNLQDPDNPLDIGFVGDVQSIDPSVIKVLQNDQFIPVISPIAYNEEDDAVYNINADIVAGRIAQVMMAEKLVLLTDIRGVLDKEKQLIKRLNTKSINELIEDGTISGGMLPKLTGALEAANAGVNSVHIIDGRVPHSLLLEILTNDGVGSMITV
ncbi:Acetylglutamate kinase [Oligella ureolytica]|uniref:Acetylglutamate kinase n=1 Tax=Oligella ureolytica TaxID=90244 RepID=A0A378XGC6_9BURK|nr:acetylglutamate kinase [Oligella ureolytica]NLP32544.1 acetylglutamate kinase [Oligella ureolytica]QPT41032.1 acetylglutamate kinase [Oligella ureolytica]SUA53496.1 Acetylglutamate kinase [Oligella ureolytica]SUA53567.1 Acetylglutamate kinase [Oligella ureolytica]